MIVKFFFSAELRHFKPPQLPMDVHSPLFLNLYKCDSNNIAKHIHRLKVKKVQMGGCTYLFTNDKVGLAVGVKGSAFKSGALVTQKTRQIGFKDIVLIHSELNHQLTAQVVSGIIQANYQFKLLGNDAQKQVRDDEHEGKYNQIQYIHVDEDLYEDPYLQELIGITKYKLYARDLANMRQDGTPLRFVEEAKKLFKDNPKVTLEVIEGESLVDQGLNLIYNVGKGSQHKPALINLTYKGNPNSQEIYSLVGKGVTFDMGGLHLKPYGSMETMYIDKSGACNVLAAFRGCVEMGLKVNVTATLGMAENAISEKSYKPSDIIRSHKGLTVEINNTDAEGRLVLADCLSWTQSKYRPKEIVEVSTLTGACQAALGENMGGIMGQDNHLVEELVRLSNEVEEPLWRLPVTDEHREMMKGDHADLCNIGKSKLCGASKAAAFLQNFVSQESKYAHIDIAGPSHSKGHGKLHTINPAGATGFSTSILLKYLIKRQN